MRSSDGDKRPRRKWPLLLAAMGAVLFFVGVSTVRETYRRYEVDQEVSSLQQQVEQLERRKLDLSHVVQSLNSADTVDEQARLRLGLQKPGERVFIIDAAQAAAPSWQDGLVLPATSTDPMDSIRQTGSNPQKWFAYFFFDHHL